MLASSMATEFFCRFYLGLGDPPLSIADSEIEYLFAPNQNCRRFGNLVQYNAWSMRSDDIPAEKATPNELRILVFGDSVINGGSLTDQSNVPTSILKRELTRDLNRSVIVGNVSAGSWGPPNILAYARRYGFFHADFVVIVLSSHDYADAPTFKPTVGVNVDFPNHKPWCATWEAISRYLPRFLPGFHREPSSNEPSLLPPTQKDIDSSLSAIGEFIKLARQSGAKLALAQHLELDELPPARPKPGHDAIANVARAAGVNPFVLEPAGSNKGLYRDRIHPNSAGQALIAARLKEAIIQMVNEYEPSKN
jgi:hypothetical protein